MLRVLQCLGPHSERAKCARVRPVANVNDLIGALQTITLDNLLGHRGGIERSGSRFLASVLDGLVELQQSAIMAANQAQWASRFGVVRQTWRQETTAQGAAPQVQDECGWPVASTTQVESHSQPPCEDRSTFTVTGLGAASKQKCEENTGHFNRHKSFLMTTGERQMKSMARKPIIGGMPAMIITGRYARHSAWRGANPSATYSAL